jgi:superfamily I DNA and/or RNA helicase
MSKLIDSYVNNFTESIQMEMEAMKKRQGVFEVEIYDGRRVKSKKDNSNYYSFKLKFNNEKVVKNAECDLRCEGFDFLVTIDEIEKKKIILRSDKHISMNGDKYLLVFYPWFLYDNLQRVLDSLKTEPNFYLKNALMLFGERDCLSENKQLLAKHEQINDSQLKAIQHCMNSNLTFIWGPPGTGKTSTLSHLILELVKTESRVLIASTTNAAIQQVLSKLNDNTELSETFETGKILRVGSAKEESYGTKPIEVYQRLNKSYLDKIRKIQNQRLYCKNQLQTCTELLDKKHENEQPLLSFDLSKEVEFSSINEMDLEKIYPRKRARIISRSLHSEQCGILESRKLKLRNILKLYEEKIAFCKKENSVSEQSIIQNSAVVLSTLTNLYMNKKLLEERFDVIIVDEAGMAIQPLLFYCASLSKNKVIMIGDPKQLSPITVSKNDFVYQNMGRNIFDICALNPYKSEKVVMLNTQYRMHRDIGALVSEVFYEGKLKTSETIQRDSIVKSKPFNNKSFIIVDTKGKGECNTKEGSYSRYNEVSAAYCAELAEQAIDSDISCVIITPYNAQVQLIKEYLRSKHISSDKVECSTVHRFQGKERDMVIFDTVDSAPMSPGVLIVSQNKRSSSDNLLNVSLSRACGKLIIVSDVNYFFNKAGESTISKVFRIGESRGVVIDMVEN